MWMVAKIKKREIKIFKKNITEKIGKNIQFYYPKVEYEKFIGNKIKRFEKYVLENYIFCYHPDFSKDIFINKVRFLKGLEYFLSGHSQNQNEIIKFINYCKAFENNKGCLTQAFFKEMINKKAKFTSGPFANMMFEIIEKQKNKLKVIIGNIKTTISDKTNYFYLPV